MLDLLIAFHERKQMALEIAEAEYNRDALIERYLDCMNGFDESLLQIEEVVVVIDLVRENGVPMIECCGEHWPMPDELMWLRDNPKAGGYEALERPVWLCTECGKFVEAKWVEPVIRTPS